MRKTYNGAPTLKRTSSACVDLFAFVGAARRHPAQVVQVFERAYLENPSMALRVLLWTRDARGGAGERDTFRNILHWLERRHPAVAAALVRSGIITEIGRWDDLLGLQSAQVWPDVVDQVYRALRANDRLVAKWLPRKGPVATKLRMGLGATEAQWRSGLAAASDTVEQRMCAGDWAGIDFSSIPSVAAARYQVALAGHAGPRYTAYLDDVQAGRAKMHASAVFPHDVLKASVHNDAAATVQWAQLPRPALAGLALVLCDVSGSMDKRVSGSSTALDVCVALGLLLSETLPAPFKNKILTFTSTPSLHEVTGNTLAQRSKNLREAKWGGSTNIQAAFDLVLRKAGEAEAGFVMPKVLIVLSDMEFDVADSRGATNHEAMRHKFAAAGFEIPVLVYWNLCGRAGNLPAGNVPGVVLVSGFSARVADTLLSGDFDSLTPESAMGSAVGIPRYDVPGLTAPVDAPPVDAS